MQEPWLLRKISVCGAKWFTENQQFDFAEFDDEVSSMFNAVKPSLNSIFGEVLDNAALDFGKRRKGGRHFHLTLLALLQNYC